ncbi:MAG: histidine kinase [Spirosomaceae bacterium]|nr:histidine kinase [Spirosomataceae bacterium]
MSLSKIKYWLIPIFWVVVTILMTAQDYIASQLRDYPFYLVESLIFKIKWLVYIPITFLVFEIGKRFPIKQPKLITKLSIHIAISLIISILSLCFTSVIMTYLWQKTGDTIQYHNVLKKMISTAFLNEFVNYWLILGVHNGISIFEEYQQAKIDKSKLEKQLSESKLNALKMQLQPHFLFNTHHNIIGLMQKGDTEKATQMLMKLSDLLRLSLKENIGDLVPLRNEIQLLSLYFEIIKIRFEERLSYQFLIDKHLENALVPPMLLQPIVENAIKYGIEPYAKRGEIEVRVEPLLTPGRASSPIRGKLKLIIKDNGIDNQSFTNFNFGIGLSNTQHRLETLFGKDGQLNIISNEPQSGITVELTMPLIK